MQQAACDVLENVSGPQNLRVPNVHHPSRGGVSHAWKGPGIYDNKVRKFTSPVGCGCLNASMSSTLSQHDCVKSTNVKQTSYGAARIPGYFSGSTLSWTNDHVAPTVTHDARLLINEDDWLKYQYMAANPTVNAGYLEQQKKKKHHSDDFTVKKPAVDRNNVTRYGYQFYF